MTARTRRPAAVRLASRVLTVGGRTTSCVVGGVGPPVVLLHGWGLGHRSYRRALRELMGRGFRVYAPALPGFGGTASLPAHRRTMAGYAAWVDEFFTAAGIDGSAIVIGHSFGGGVAIRFAHDFPARVRRLVLINSVGHRTRSDGSGAAARTALRPLWVVGLHFAREMFASRHSHRIMRAIAEDATMNVVANPWSFVSVGRLVRQADLVAELGELQRRGLAVLVLWGSGDGTLPRSSFDALSAASGTEGMMMKGGHLWLIAQPSKLGDMVADFLQADGAEGGVDGTAGRGERSIDRGRGRGTRRRS